MLMSSSHLLTKQFWAPEACSGWDPEAEPGHVHSKDQSCPLNLLLSILLWT